MLDAMEQQHMPATSIMGTMQQAIQGEHALRAFCMVAASDVASVSCYTASGCRGLGHLKIGVTPWPAQAPSAPITDTCTMQCGSDA